jgi:hypothetical protein
MYEDDYVEVVDLYWKTRKDLTFEPNMLLSQGGQRPDMLELEFRTSIRKLSLHRKGNAGVDRINDGDYFDHRFRFHNVKDRHHETLLGATTGFDKCLQVALATKVTKLTRGYPEAE